MHTIFFFSFENHVQDLSINVLVVVELLLGVDQDSIDNHLLVVSGELLTIEPLNRESTLFGGPSGEELFEALLAVADLADPFGRLLRLLHLIGQALTALQNCELLSHCCG